MNRAVFIDRDGVINNEEGHYYIYKEKDFFLNPGVTDLLKFLKKKSFLLIVITNQGGIAKGEYTIEHVHKVHEKLHLLLKKEGIYLDEIYFCPHHTSVEKCLCRKPGTVSLEKAICRFNIDPGKSFFIGDRETDMQAGKKMGINTILVKANQDLSYLKESIIWDVN